MFQKHQLDPPTWNLLIPSIFDTVNPVNSPQNKAPKLPPTKIRGVTFGFQVVLLGSEKISKKSKKHFEIQLQETTETGAASTGGGRCKGTGANWIRPGIR